MQLQDKLRNTVRGLLQAYGTGRIKRRLWDTEFARGRWDCLDETQGDCVYPYVEKYAKRGSILDLGCGSGSTGVELLETAYTHYTGVDISEVAIDKARRRSDGSGHSGKHSYFQSDIFSYVPPDTYDVILFRDSIYYIPHGKIVGMLDRYKAYLRDTGVFVVRMASGSDKYSAIVSGIENHFEVIDRYACDEPQAVVLVFRPRRELTP